MKTQRSVPASASAAFTLVELVVLSALVAAMACLALPSLANASVTSVGITCRGNLGQLGVAWQLYANDNGGKVVNNFQSAGTQNWALNMMDWSTNPSNTNRNLASASRLSPYLQDPVNVIKCPADGYLSSAQKAAGWTKRLRSYSMNGFMGPSSASKTDPSYQGQNSFFPQHRQFILQSSIVRPSTTAVLLDEHPDSINDGYFINGPGTPQWYDLPGSQHAGAGGVSFADGSVEIKSWVNSSTRAAVRYGIPSTGPLAPSQRQDWEWLTYRMTVPHQTLGAVPAAQTQATFIWSPQTSSYLLQSSPSITEPSWVNVSQTPVKASGQVSVTLPTDATAKYFRLIR